MECFHLIRESSIKTLLSINTNNLCKSIMANMEILKYSYLKIVLQNYHFKDNICIEIYNIYMIHTIKKVIIDFHAMYLI